MPSHSRRALCAVFAAALMGQTPLWAAEPLDFDCARMAAAIGAPATDLDPSPDNGWQISDGEARLVCNWATEPAERLRNGGALQRTDYPDLGFLNAQLTVYDSPLDRATAAMMKAAHDAPEGTPPGSWMFAMKAPVLTDPISLAAPELMSGALGVSVAQAAAFSKTASSLGGLTTGWGVEAAARILTAATR